MCVNVLGMQGETFSNEMKTNRLIQVPTAVASSGKFLSYSGVIRGLISAPRQRSARTDYPRRENLEAEESIRHISN